MRLKDLTKKTRKVTISIDGETAEVEYRTHSVTPSMLNELRALDDLDGIIYQVEQTVERWEVLDDDGKEIPATREAILQFRIPLEFLTAVLNAITDDLKQDAEAKNA
jgi:hypothetical protein